MRGIDVFSEALTNAVWEILRPVIDENVNELNEAIINNLFDMEGPTKLEKGHDNSNRFFSKIFLVCKEIVDTYEVIKDIARYTRRFPFRDNYASRTRYLQYNIENFFNEVYILEERLIALITNIERGHKATPQQISAHDMANQQKKFVKDGFLNLRHIRSTHVHENRYVDLGLEKLKSLEWLSIYSKELSGLFREQYIKTYLSERKKWIKKMDEIIGDIKALLDRYFDSLYDFVFDSDGKLLL